MDSTEATIRPAVAWSGAEGVLEPVSRVEIPDNIDADVRDVMAADINGVQARIYRPPMKPPIDLGQQDPAPRQQPTRSERRKAKAAKPITAATLIDAEEELRESKRKLKAKQTALARALKKQQTLASPPPVDAIRETVEALRADLRAAFSAWSADHTAENEHAMTATSEAMREARAALARAEEDCKSLGQRRQTVGRTVGRTRREVNLLVKRVADTRRSVSVIRQILDSDA